MISETMLMHGVTLAQCHLDDRTRQGLVALKAALERQYDRLRRDPADEFTADRVKENRKKHTACSVLLKMDA
jgi:hypothetical protein